MSHRKPIDCNDPHELNQAICVKERQFVHLKSTLVGFEKRRDDVSIF